MARFHAVILRKFLATIRSNSTFEFKSLSYTEDSKRSIVMEIKGTFDLYHSTIYSNVDDITNLQCKCLAIIHYFILQLAERVQIN